MKTLFIGYGKKATADPNEKISTLADTNPFGYDTIVINPLSVSKMIGSGGGIQTMARWNAYLTRWFAPHRRLIVILRPKSTELNIHSYMWLPTSVDVDRIYEAGSDDFVGQTVGPDVKINHFLADSSNEFTVAAHYRHRDADENIYVNSRVDDDLSTSFIYRKDDMEILFVPEMPLTSLRDLVAILQSDSNNWKTEAISTAESEMQQIETDLAQVVKLQQDKERQLTQLNNQVSQLISSNVYLERAIQRYELTLSQEYPDPELFYEAIENIENHFPNERTMRESIGVSKAFVGKITRRTNDFRHAQKSGAEPTPLKQEEITEFRDKVAQIIQKFIEYLLANS